MVLVKQKREKKGMYIVCIILALFFFFQNEFKKLLEPFNYKLVKIVAKEEKVYVVFLYLFLLSIFIDSNI